jgi:hydrogenase maturation protein HypF
MSDPGAKTTRRRCRISVVGRVQGVGFRPAIFRALAALGCAGSVRNTPEGAVVEVEADGSLVDRVVREFRSLIPPRARIDEMLVEQLSPRGDNAFRIASSKAEGPSLLPVPPDLATCDACLAELCDARDRRAGYPFNTCTACGPRFTIAREVPFDRPANSMSAFEPCSRCRQEYLTPSDRRFHAQTVSCPACGPRVRLLMPDRSELPDPLPTAVAMLSEGKVLAVKGLGGFHLACDATHEDAVRELRRRKGRFAKPFAIMVPSLRACGEICHVDGPERDLLTSAQAPIVLLRKRKGSRVADSVAPGLADLGVMLPYTPLHALLFADPSAPPALVMTSCNRSEEPIAVDEEHVLVELGDVVDGVLTHDRSIANRCDDSVLAVALGRPVPLRRSRGYVPEPVVLQAAGPPLLATGGMLKNVFALTSGRRVFLSQHIGDVSDADNAAYFARSFEQFSHLLRLEPEGVVCDLHPDYPTTRFAQRLAAERSIPLLQVQQHHAHIVSCLADNGRDGPVIGVSWDGTGYGEDGAVWGGEFMIADRRAYERRCHLAYVPMPGGEQAVLQPTRMALAHLAAALGEEEAGRRLAPVLGRQRCDALLRLMQQADFSPQTSSAGRLFDAVAALLGVCTAANYEGQPACELEAACCSTPGRGYSFTYNGDDIVLEPLWRELCRDLDRGVSPGHVAAEFHATMAHTIVETCRRLRKETGIATVALSGGVMQNRVLLAAAVPLLEADGFDVLTHGRVPPNDGGLCLGQAACALARWAD